MPVAMSEAPRQLQRTNDFPALPVYRFTVQQYHRLIETGILTHSDRVELLEGRVVTRMPFNPPHNIAITRINRRLLPLLPEEWLLQVQGAITMRGSEPEPDFAIIRGPEEAYLRRKPVPRDVALIIEVADRSLLEDRLYKSLLYAQARIPEYWIVNLVAQQIEVHTHPQGGKSPKYRQQRIYRADERVPLILNSREIARIAVRDVLPR